ncbi:MAG: hypothetical protein HYS12_07365 [Planctomycetes bacterium]|nr:hypothetical protein [Planctomycetota bacterium]
MQNATQNPAPRQRPLPPVSGTCRWPQPVGYDPDPPDVGMVEINGRRYTLGVAANYFLLLAVEPDRQGKKGCYHLPRDLSSCECGDHVFRADRREDGRCKHQKSLAKLLVDGIRRMVREAA